jgi:hydrogenase maturation protease
MQAHTTLIIGCGNLLRGDDALGPRLVRRLWELGMGDHVRLSDGGTAGMNVAFDMRGMREVVIVDACRPRVEAGEGEPAAEPGALYEIPGAEAQTPPLNAVNLHNFRWDHALAFGRWLLKDEYPAKITVFLVEGAQFESCAELSTPVAEALEKLAALLVARYGRTVRVELTAAGNLIVPAAFAAQRFACPNVMAQVRGRELIVSPLAENAVGGFMLKQRNLAGDRAVLVKERLPDDAAVGVRTAVWDECERVLRVPLDVEEAGEFAVAADVLAAGAVGERREEVRAYAFGTGMTGHDRA